MALSFGSCSVKKNSAPGRAYHGTTTHYNFYFNARERMKAAAATLYEGQQDQYDRILPIFKYGDVNQAKGVFPDLDEAIKKVSIAITRHSMDVRSKKDSRVAERNKWIDDCYLLIGQCQFYKHEYWTAIETFQFISSEYKDSEIRPEALLWLTKTYLELGKNVDAEYLLDYLKNDKKFPDQLLGHYNAVVAQFHMQKGDLPRATEALKKAAATTKKKESRARYSFILGQLYQKADSLQEAFKEYDKVLKLNPPYEMAFHARINRARCFDTASGSSELVRRELNKMLKDEKNKEFLDQIYYALAGIERQEGDEERAIDFLNLALQNAGSNQNQSALSYLELADIYLDRPEYIPAAAYYDSALTKLSQDHPEYLDVQAKRNSLDRLVKNLKIIMAEDSLQKLSSLTQAEKEAMVDDMISRENAEKERLAKEKEAQQKMEEQEVQAERELRSQPRQTAAPGSAATGSWYFYNISAISFGTNEFIKRWGNRKLEDNWRRSEKEVVMELAGEGESIDSLANKQGALNDSISKLDDAARRAAYLAMIPTSSQSLKESDVRITEAYYNVGVIYKEQLNNLPESNRTFEELDKRFPDNKYKLASYYNMYRSYSALKMEEKAEYYKNYLVTNFPESDYAKLILNPNYYKDIQRKSEVLEVFYENTYRAFQKGQYELVIERKNTADEMFPPNKLTPKFAMLKAMAIGRTRSINEFELALEDVIRTYPKDTVSVRAKQMLEVIKRGSISEAPRDTGQDAAKAAQMEEKIAAGAVTFSFAPDQPQQFLIIYKKGSLNQQSIQNNLEIFNERVFAGRGLKVLNGNIDLNYKYMIVNSFPDKKDGMMYYQTVMAEPGLLSGLDPADVQFYVISQENLGQLAQSRNFQAYSRFFQKNYLQ
jgi:tetratricopeptide (TPR) repeat protein